jgi:hypothetical protein
VKSAKFAFTEFSEVASSVEFSHKLRSYERSVEGHHGSVEGESFAKVV